MREIKFRACPHCKGTGKVVDLQKGIRKYTDSDIEKVVYFYKQGKSLREICKIMKIKHPYSVSYLINRHFQEINLLNNNTK